VFIRAPWVEENGEGVEVLAEIDGHPVAVRDANVLAVAFHPELTDDSRVHALFLAMVSTGAAQGAQGEGAQTRRPRSRRRGAVG
jgi:5'-phosphate synthase pdxT subunit